MFVEFDLLTMFGDKVLPWLIDLLVESRLLLNMSLTEVFCVPTLCTWYS